MKAQEAIRNRLRPVLAALAAVGVVVGIEVTEAEINATVEAALQAVAAVTGLYAAVRVWIDKVRGI